jgi:hypothetical protein
METKNLIVQPSAKSGCSNLSHPQAKSIDTKHLQVDGEARRAL